jgi:hypothetical protein
LVDPAAGSNRSAIAAASVMSCPPPRAVFGMARASWIAVRRAGMKFHPARAGKAASVSMSTRIGIISLAGQPTPASRTGAVMLTGDRDLCRDDLHLQGEGELLRLGETGPEVGQTSLLIAFDASHLDLRRLSGLQRHHQLDPHTSFAIVHSRPAA